MKQQRQRGKKTIISKPHGTPPSEACKPQRSRAPIHYKHARCVIIPTGRIVLINRPFVVWSVVCRPMPT